jgi:hypothetical protein
LKRKNGASSDVTGDDDSDATGDALLTSQKKDEKERKKDEIRSVFEAWASAAEHPRAKLDEKRSRRISARLDEGFTPEQLIQAVNSWRLDPWLTGKNPDGKVYDELESLLRDAAKVERLLDLGSGKGSVIDIK